MLQLIFRLHKKRISRSLHYKLNKFEKVDFQNSWPSKLERAAFSINNLAQS